MQNKKFYNKCVAVKYLVEQNPCEKTYLDFIAVSVEMKLFIKSLTTSKQKDFEVETIIDDK